MQIKIDKADRKFSQFIRLRDKRCMRCGSRVEFNEKGEPITHQSSHYWSRGKESVRFDPENLDTLCFACHNLWGHGDERDKYKEFKIKQLGMEGFKRLDVRAHTNGKKDRKMALMIAKKLYEEEIKINAQRETRTY